MLSSRRSSPLVRASKWGLTFLLTGQAIGWIFAAEPNVGEARPAAMISASDAVSIEEQTLGGEQSLERLEELGPQVRASVAMSLDLVASTNAPLDLRRRAVLTLATWGFEEPESVRVLFDLLTDPGVAPELRQTILVAFGDRERLVPLLTPALLNVVGERRNDAHLRRQALIALHRFSRPATVVTALGAVLARADDDIELRMAILDDARTWSDLDDRLLASMTGIVLNSDEPLALRIRALETLRGLGSQARASSPGLVQLVMDGTSILAVRVAAAQALRQIGWPESDAIPLARVSFHTETPAELRTALVELIGWMDPPPAMVETEWRPVLEDQAAPLPVRRLAARMLARADLGLPSGVEFSSRLLRDETEDLEIRLAAGEFLRRAGSQAAPAREMFEEMLLDPDGPRALREIASTALAQVAQTWLERPDRLDRRALNERLMALDQVLAVMERAGLAIPPHPQNLEAVRRLRDVLWAEKSSRWLSPLADWAEAQPRGARWAGVLASVILGGAGLSGLWWLLSWMAPRRLLWIERRLRPLEVRLPSQLGSTSIGLRQLLLLGCWTTHRRVVDAWVRDLWAGWATRSGGRITGQMTVEAADFLPQIPLTVDGKPLDDVPLAAVRHRLTQPSGCVIIQGEAGTGKTSLARQVVGHARGPAPTEASQNSLLPFPVWLDAPIRDASAMLGDRVLHQLYEDGHPPEDGPSTEILRRWIDDGHFLFVLDGWSEWSLAEQASTRRSLAAYPRAPILVTTRQADHGLDRSALVLRLSRWTELNVARYLQKLLQCTPAGQRFGEADRREAVRLWTALTAGRPMPADAVALYAEYLVLLNHGTHDHPRPQNMVELTVDWLRVRLAKVPPISAAQAADEPVHLTASDPNGERQNDPRSHVRTVQTMSARRSSAESSRWGRMWLGRGRRVGLEMCSARRCRRSIATAGSAFARGNPSARGYIGVDQCGWPHRRNPFPSALCHGTPGGGTFDPHARSR